MAPDDSPSRNSGSSRDEAPPHDEPPPRDDSPPDEHTSGHDPDTIQSTEELYEVTYHATRTAIWDVLGDVVLTLVLVFFAFASLQLIFASLFATATALLPAVFGLAVLLVTIGGLLYLHGFWPFD